MVEIPLSLCYIGYKEGAHSKVDAPKRKDLPLRASPILWLRQDRHFYFFLFLLSRKARNAIIKLPKVANNVSIPMKIERISNAVISRTSLPMYSRKAGSERSGRLPPLSWALSLWLPPRSLLYHSSLKYTINPQCFLSGFLTSPAPFLISQ